MAWGKQPDTPSTISDKDWRTLQDRARKTIRLGPVRLHFTQNGFSSWGLKVGPWTWNAKTGRHSVDTPGPGGVQLGGGPKRRRRGAR